MPPKKKAPAKKTAAPRKTAAQKAWEFYSETYISEDHEPIAHVAFMAGYAAGQGNDLKDPSK